MNQPQQQPHRPVPGPTRPHPEVVRADRPMPVEPAAIGLEVAVLIEQVDQLRAAASEQGVGPAAAMFTRSDTDGAEVVAELARLDRQADLLEQAHDVLTTSLERLDRV